MHTMYIVILALSAALFTWFGTLVVRQVMLYLAVVDVPDERRNHTLPTPRGAGIAVVLFSVMFMIVASADGHYIAIGFLLALLCLYDDVKGLSVKFRLLAQALLVGLMMVSYNELVFQGVLPIWADKLASGIMLLVFINIYNFMDGIDEITTAETLGITLGMTVVYILSDLHIGLLADAWIVTGAILGFWYWNRHPAKIFLGDSGSIPVGFYMGVLLLIMSSRGYEQAALILPAYYLVDGLTTLSRRALKGEKVWQAHSEHGYQKAVRAGWSHRHVSSHVMVLNLLLAVLAGASVLGSGLEWVMVAVAYVLSFMLYAYFLSAKPTSGSLDAHPAT